MNKKNRRLLLKVKKRRDSTPAPVKFRQALNSKENETLKQGQKRQNPFSKTEIVKKSLFHKPLQTVENLFLIKLDASDNNKYAVKSPKCVSLKNSNPSQISFDGVNSDVTSELKYTYENKQFPLDWSLKQKVRFTASKPFTTCQNIRSIHESKGIADFTQRNVHDTDLCGYLHNWLHPSIPGIPHFPIKSRFTVGVKDDKVINTIANNKTFEDLLMAQWRLSFQSLFNMLKTKHCPYFYLCCYQFTVLFKAAGVGDTCMNAIVTPTTKGFRQMLKEEDISFDLPLDNQSCNPTSDSASDIEEENEEEEDKDPLNDSNNDDFLDSIGLNKEQHFPTIQEQQRLAVKSKMRQLDNRPESTIKVKNCQGLFNFLLNSKCLCAPSGSMIGVPPTLFSPSPFEGATLSKCKISHGPIKFQKNSSFVTVHCVDISGYILPSQLKDLVNLFAREGHDDLNIQTKTFEKLRPLNINGNEHCRNTADDVNCRNTADDVKFGMFSATMDYLNQQCHCIPNHSDVTYSNGEFKF